METLGRRAGCCCCDAVAVLGGDDRGDDDGEGSRSSFPELPPAEKNESLSRDACLRGVAVEE